ncbi:hypothetical protein HanIR_Chr14g0711511 [Helianthus annuus]|nr:hypothetical protein HanIR_Chr14g0711511 [Helianthus annuus]
MLYKHKAGRIPNPDGSQTQNHLPTCGLTTNKLGLIKLGKFQTCGLTTHKLGRFTTCGILIAYARTLRPIV